MTSESCGVPKRDHHVEIRDEHEVRVGAVDEYPKNHHSLYPVNEDDESC